MNNWYNFQIPYFNGQFGTDWTAFETIVDSEVDCLMNKTYELYWLNDVGRMPVMAVDMVIRLRNIEVGIGESIAVKKQKIRSYNKDFKSKGMKATYLDYQELIVGTRGEIYNGYTLGTMVWGVSVWAISGSPESTDRIWSTTSSQFEIYIDVKTTDSGLLDQIQAIYRQGFLLPAFYQIYLVDSDLNILRTV